MKYADLEPEQTIVWAAKEGVVTKAYKEGNQLIPFEQGEQNGDERSNPSNPTMG